MNTPDEIRERARKVEGKLTLVDDAQGIKDRIDAIAELISSVHLQVQKQVEAGRRAAEALVTVCKEENDFGGRNRIIIHGGFDHQKGMPCKVCEALTLCREAGLLDEPI